MFHDQQDVQALKDLCAANARGKACTSPKACVERDRVFTCPRFRQTGDWTEWFEHEVKTHTLANCKVRDPTKACDGKRLNCIQTLRVVDVLGSCTSIEKGEPYVRLSACQYGHDLPVLRKLVLG